MFIQFEKRQQNKEQKGKEKKKWMPMALGWRRQRRKNQKQKLGSQEQGKKKPRKGNTHGRVYRGTPPQRFLFFF